MHDMKGKRLLILGGTSASYDLVRNAKAMGIYTVVTDDGTTHRVAKEIADDTAKVSTADLDGLAALIKEKNIDGVFCGPSEFNLRNVIRLCEKTGLPCYTNMEVWDRCANKDVFKRYCREYGVDCTPEYDVVDCTAEYNAAGSAPTAEMKAMEFPVIVKPVDGSSSAGVTVCHRAGELPSAMARAYAASKCERIIVEKYLENSGRVFSVRYLLRDGEAYPYFMMDTYVVSSQGAPNLISGFSRAPSQYSAYYMEHMDEKVRQMLKGMGLHNGTAFLQGIPYKGRIYFHEMGYRLSGGMIFKLTEPLVGINDMKIMLRGAVGGERLTDDEIAAIDLNCKGRVGGQLMVPLSVGTIGEIQGMDKIKEHPAVCDVIQYYRTGDCIEQRHIGTLGQHFCRITFLVDSQEDLESAIAYFQEKLRITDTEGNRMNRTPFDVGRMKSYKNNYKENIAGRTNMELTGKTLLLMGGGAYARDIQKYKAEKGFRIVALGRDAGTPIAKISDAFYQIDTQDVDGVIDVVKKEGVDGIFVGSSEVNISPATKVAELTGVRFYTTWEQWEILANKAKFKEYCRKYDVPVVPEYQLPANYTRADVEKLPFPVMLKPTDSSGARGMNACYSAEEFDELYAEALKWSKKKEVIIEKLITDADEVFFQYTLQDGVCSLTSCFTKVFVKSENKNLILPIFHMYPSRYIDEYFDHVHEGVKKLFHALGLRNGVMTLQSFYTEGQFYIFEAGFRMGGAQNYILTDYQWGINSLECMVNYALTGSMNDTPIIDIDNARFRHPCCNYYVGLKAGVIAKMGGVDEVKKLDGVLNVTEMCGEGTEILETNALERICLRIHVVGATSEKLANTLVKISNTLRILSTDGEEMQIEHLTYERCLEAIHHTTTF